MSALFLLHGYPFNHSMWEPVMRQLEVESPVLAPDFRGFGLTSPPAEEPALERWAEDLNQLQDELGDDSVVLAGFSMGGYVALAFAEQFGKRLAGLVLINSQSAADNDATRKVRRQLQDRVRQDGPMVAVEAALPKMFAGPDVVPPELTEYPRQGAAAAGVEGICWALEAMARRPDRTPVLRSVAVPVLIIHTDQDQFVPVERARELAAGIPEMQYKELSGVGHCSPLEAPGQVAALLSGFVKTCVG